jgi:hypothetical protein
MLRHEPAETTAERRLKISALPVAAKNEEEKIEQLITFAFLKQDPHYR